MAEYRDQTIADFEGAPAHLEWPAGSRSWYTRGQGFIVEILEARAGERLTSSCRDEHILILDTSAAATIGEQEIAAHSLTILPPGETEIAINRPGMVVRVFTSREQELARLCCNAHLYPSEGDAIDPWPMPVGGYRMRNYPLAHHRSAEQPFLAFRTRRLMACIYSERTTPRDPRDFTPHVHESFEQASIVLAGRWRHHRRFPWDWNFSQWRDDVHQEVGSPSVSIVPAGVLHTSQNLTPGESRIMDAFAPPRLDYSLRPGLVRNAAEYPMAEDGAGAQQE